MKRAKWDELIIDAVIRCSDYQGEAVDVQEVIDDFMDNCVMPPQRPTVLKHILRLVGEGKLEKSFTVAYCRPPQEV